ncbi:hypothetical protein, partial [Arthrobacter sp. Bi83]|uniref:hypothetical protein n=1 Tax=Arthrobacter sp. Bi83 TaxID=2822353 RepID=UPI001E41C41A
MNVRLWFGKGWAGLAALGSGWLGLVRYFHLEAAPAPQYPGPEVGPEEVCWPRLGGEWCVGISQVRIGGGHGFPAVDVLGAQVHDVIG